MKKHNKKYITLRWLDCFSDEDWKTKEEIAKWVKENKLCTTIGEITYEDKNVIVLSASFDGEDGYGENMCILKSCIIK